MHWAFLGQCNGLGVVRGGTLGIGLLGASQQGRFVGFKKQVQWLLSWFRYKACGALGAVLWLVRCCVVLGGPRQLQMGFALSGAFGFVGTGKFLLGFCCCVRVGESHLGCLVGILLTGASLFFLFLISLYFVSCVVLF